MSLVENMQQVANEIISSFQSRKRNLEELERRVKELLRLFEIQRAEMRAELQAELRDFIAKLEAQVRQLLQQFAEERVPFQQELLETQKVWAELVATMERLRREDP